MKKSISLLFTALMLCTLSLPAFAAEEPTPGKDSCYYPISVEEYTYGPLDELRIDKVYQLSLDDDPGGIPTEDFTRGGRLYYLLDMTKKDEVGVDTKPYEGYPRFYDKRMVTVQDGLGRSLSVMAYIMDERFREPMLPSTSYYNGILEGYRQNRLPMTALKKAWDHAVQEVHQETEQINAAAADRPKPPKRRSSHDR